MLDVVLTVVVTYLLVHTALILGYASIKLIRWIGDR
jgi:hypothetical protein